MRNDSALLGGVLLHVLTNGTEVATPLTNVMGHVGWLNLSGTFYNATLTDQRDTSLELNIPGLAFPDFAGYVALDEGEYDLEVRIAGTEDVALQLDPLALAGDTAYTVFAIGSSANGTLTALPVVDGEAAMDEMMDEEMDEEMAEE